ncbi:MAG: glycosyltransferase [Microbispora sp.]|nr:glycosyltransferase [Microbispora sp.]
MPEAVSAPVELVEAEQRLAEALAGLPTIVCFANDWGGDPTSKQHVMRIFAEHADILWVESSGMRVPRLTSAHDVRRIAQRVRKALRPPVGVASQSGSRERPPRLRVLSPLSVPLPGNPVAEAVTRRLYRRALAGALEDLGESRPPVHWVYTPTVAPAIRDLPRRGLVYHCVDRWWAFTDYNAEVMRRHHEWLCRNADVVFASAAELYEDCRAHTDRVHLMRHGVEWEHFARAALDPAPRPADIAEIAGPILGFFGLLHEWVDQDVVCALADAFPETTIVLIGKVQTDVSRLQRRPNIRLLGQKPYATLPAYAAHFDVALIPFVQNELTVAVNPIKLREYLSAGLPVVATALPEIRLFAGNPRVWLASEPAAHVEGVRHFLSRGWDAATRRSAAREMAGDSWIGRCAMMARLVGAALGTLPAAPATDDGGVRPDEGGEA